MRLGRRRPTPIAAVAAIGVVVVVLPLAAWSILRDGDSTDAAGEPSIGARERADLAILSVMGAPDALLAVVGSGGSTAPAALVVPSGTTIVAPGQGETPIEEVASLPGDAMRTAVSNALGAWAGSFGVLDLDALSAAVDRAGGLRVEIPEPVTVAGQVVGPGAVTLTGPQVESYLQGAGDESTLRWMVVLEGLLRGLVLEEGDLIEADDPGAVVDGLAAASDASANLMPTQVVGATTEIPAQPAFDEMMAELFATPPPIPVVVENGSGEAGIGELVGSRIIPEGFRVVLSHNAESFRYETTQITATGDDHVDDAEAIRDALGTGDVQVTQVPSGLADVVIVTGKDLQV